MAIDKKPSPAMQKLDNIDGILTAQIPSRLLDTVWIILLEFICLGLEIVGFFCEPLGLLIGFIRVSYKTGSVLAINQSLRSTF